jgi:hypothetical protein
MFGDYLTAIKKMNNNEPILKLIKIGDVPNEQMQTNDQIYNEGRRVQFAQQRLQNASVYFEDTENSQIGFYVMPKRNPYVPEPSMDHMIYVAKEERTIRSMAELTPELAAKLFNLGFKISNLYQEIGKDHGGVALNVMSLNYHRDPIYDQSLFGKKVYAQSIKDIHLHVFAITEYTYQSLEDVDVTKLSKMLKDYMLEPFEIVLRSLYDTSLVTDLLDPTIFQRISDNRFEGISFVFSPTLLQQTNFYPELINLHSKLEDLYQRVAGIFVDVNRQDTKGMPLIYSTAQIDQNIENFISDLTVYPKRLKTILQRLGRVVKSSELLVDPSERVFLRGLAYTMSIINDKKTGRYILNISPRIFSTGNALTSLRLLYQKVPIVNHEWLEKRRARELYIRNNLGSES